MLKKRFLVIFLIAVVVVVAFVLYNRYVTFKGFTLLADLRSESTGRTNYHNAFGGLLSSNPDGAALMDYDGGFKWNISYEMLDPQVDIASDYAVIFDRRGSIIEMVDAKGEVCRINTAYPITVAGVSNNGKVAVIMQQTKVAHVNIYDSEGVVIAEGQLHGAESGYPLSLSLSSSGEQLVISALHLSGSDLKSDVIFYDFSAQGRLKEDNKTAVFSYDNEVIPIVDHVSGDRVIAIGGNGTMVFSPGVEPEVNTEIFYDSQVKSVIHNDEYFGFIKEEEDESSGELNNKLYLYTISGNRKIFRTVYSNYSKCNLTAGNEVFITDGSLVSLYTSYGVEKFNYKFDGEISDMIPSGQGRVYFLLQNGKLSKIRLK